MFALLIVVAAALIIYGQRKRVTALERKVAHLTLRMEAVEGRAAPRAAAPSPVPPERIQRPLAAPPPEAAPQAEPVRQRVMAAEPPVRAVARDDESLETRIGSRWLLYVGVCSILLGIAFFEKLAMERRWIGDTARVLQGATAGALFIAGGLRLARRGLRVYGHVLSGTGIAILYVSIYAAFNFYRLIDRGAAFVMMCGVTLVAAALADIEGAFLLALFAIGGGFVTPFLLASGLASETALFAYDALLIAGTLFIARRRKWPVLNAVSYAFTVLTVAGWVLTSYTASAYLRTELFMTLFCGLFVYGLFASRGEGGPVARLVGLLLASAPVAYYLASLGILFAHPPALFVYLVALSIGSVVVGSRLGGRVRVVGLALAAVPLLVWSNTPRAQLWIDPGLAVWAVVFALNLGGLLEATLREDGAFGDLDVVHLHANGLAAYAGIYLLIAPASTSAAASAAFGLALLMTVAAVAVGSERRDEALHFLALAFTLLTIALGLQLNGAWLTVAWAAEGAAIVFLALRERRGWLRLGGLAVFGVAVVRLLALQSVPPAPGETFVLNARTGAGLFIAAITYGLARAHERMTPPEQGALDAGIGLVAGNLLLLSVAAAEILAFSAHHPASPFGPESAIVAAALTAGGATMWLGVRRRQRWIGGVGAAVLIVAAARLVVAQLEPAPSGYTAVLNARFLAGLYAVIVAYAMAALYKPRSESASTVAPSAGMLLLVANALTITALTSEINAYWASASAGEASNRLAREMMLSVTWAVYATGLIVAGFRKQYAPLRYFAMALFGVTILKVFLVDLAELDQIYRVLSVVGLGAALLVSSYLYQRFRTAGREA